MCSVCKRRQDGSGRCRSLWKTLKVSDDKVTQKSNQKGAFGLDGEVRFTLSPPGGSQRARESLRRIRNGYATDTRKFATDIRKYATDTRKFANGYTQIRESSQVHAHIRMGNIRSYTVDTQGYASHMLQMDIMF